jgi:hypothetical protein
VHLSGSHDYSRIRLGAASDDEQAMLSALPSRHVLNLGLQWLDRVDGLDDMAHRLLLALGEVRVPAVHQQDQARLVRTVPGLVFIGVVEEDRFALAPAVLDPAHVECAIDSSSALVRGQRLWLAS